MAIEPPIKMSAEEVNVLLYSHFLDSGFQHSAFVLHAEAQINLTSLRDNFVKRGKLIELLNKGLLYSEVEAHWQPDSVTTACKAPFNILRDHYCSSNAERLNVPIVEQAEALKQGETKPLDVGSTTIKRKASEATTSGAPAEKKARTLDPMDNPTVTVTPVDFSRPPPAGSIRTLNGHETEVFVCAWNPAQPRLLASGDKGAAVHIWDVSDTSDDPTAAPTAVDPIRGQFKTEAEQADLTALDWNPEGTLLAVASYDSVLRILTDKGELYFAHPQHQGPIFAARFSRSGKYLLTGSLDGTSCVWNVAEKKLVTMYRCHLDCCLDVDWIDDETFVSCGADKLINIMRVGDIKPMKTLTGHTNEVNQVRYNRYNKHSQQLATCSDDRSARIWDLSSMQEDGSPPAIPGLAPPSAEPKVKVLRGHKNNVSTVDWCPRQFPNENWLLATSGFDGTTRIWDSGTGNCLKVFSDHKTPVFSICFSQDGQFLATGGGDGHLHVYDMRSKDRVWTWISNNEKSKDKQGIFEIDWQQEGRLDLIALTLESMEVCIIDAKRIPELRTVRDRQDGETFTIS